MSGLPRGAAQAVVLAVLLCAASLAPETAGAQTIDRSTMTNKVMCGYQGWFSCPGDGNDPAMGWSHWGSGSNIGPGFYHTEIWPDVTEYDSSDLFFVPNTVLTYGGTPYLFSPYRQGAVNVHFRWMQENGIDGGFLQRFIIECRDPNSASQRHRDQVLQNVMNASTTYGRVWAVEYDISGGNDSSLYSELVNDWTYLKNTFDIKNHSRYLYHNGKPVVVIWGIGVADRPGTPSGTQQIIDWFQADGCFVFGGIAREWRTLSGGSKTDPAWANVYRSLDGITPWTVGSYNDWNGINYYKTNTVTPDLAECNSLGILYMTTAWPRFGWDNMHGYPCGTSHFSSRGGQHLWDQVYAFRSAGVPCQFIAMMDEYDEGTAIMKCTDNVPTSGCWLTTEGNGADWFLRLANQAGRMQRGEIPVSQTMPISSGNSPDNAQIVSDTIPTTMTAGQQYSVSVTVQNNGETYWNANAFKLGAVGDYDPFYASDRVLMTPGDMIAPNQQKTFSFTMTAPTSAGTYVTDWRMVHELVRWFGATLSKQVAIGSDPGGPGPVTNLAATIADRQITLNWTNPIDADFTGTMIRYRTTSFPTSPTSGTLLCDRAAAPGSDDAYTHTNLVNGRTYYYAAWAYDGVRNYSTRVTVSAVPADVTAPGPAQSFMVTGGDARNVLSWTNPTDPDFAGVRVVLKTTGFPTGPTDGAVVYSGTGTSYNHTGLANGTSYYYSAYAFDGIPNYSTVSRGSAAPAVGACFTESFLYPDGSLSGNNGWTGAATTEIQLVDQTVRINGALGTWGVERSISSSCSPDVNGVIWLHARVKSGFGGATMWGLWLDDSAGVNLARWYGSATTARGRIGPTSSVTAIYNLTGGWDYIAARVDTVANTTEFFFNGVSVGALNHYIAANYAGDSVGRVRFERIGNADATGHYVFLDSVFVGQVERTAPGPVTSFSVIVGNGINNLLWANPADADFAGTMIRYKTTGYPTGPTDGSQVYSSTGTSFTHTGLANGVTYYYSAFAYDGFPNYSTKTDASGAPIYFDPLQAKLLPDNTPLTMTVGIVSADFTNQFYVQCPDKLVGIRVDKTAHGLGLGDSVGVKGTALVDPLNDEKYISAVWAQANATSSVSAVATSNSGVGGVDWSYNASTKAGQRGVEGGLGPGNIGLLVMVWGKVTQRDTGGLAYFYVDDGCGIADGTQTGGTDNEGIRIKCNPTNYPENSYVVVTGISSCFKDAGGKLRRQVLARTADVVGP